MKPRIFAGLLGGLFLSLATIASAAFPDHAVRLMVGFPPGTGPDIVARVIGEQLAQSLAQSVVVENKAGAGGQIAAAAASHAAPDGYTILLGEVGSISISPETTSGLTYKPLKDFAPISEAVRANFVLVVPSSSPYKSLKEFIAAAKDSKQHFNIATFGAGTPGHFGAEMLADEGGFSIEPVHYRTTGDAVSAIVAGQVQGAFITTAMAGPQITSGKMRGLAITGAQRSKILPDLPTFIESGMPATDFGAWFAFLAPAATPDAVLDTLNASIVKALASEKVRTTLEGNGFVIVGSSRQQMTDLLISEQKRWAAVVKKTGFRIN